MDDVYRRTVQRAALGMATGAMPLQQATDQAVRDFLVQGINCVQYRDGRQYPLLLVAVRAGLFHPNCRHTLTTWVEGVSERPKPMDKAKIEAVSRLEQKQRALERRVRQAKRLAAGLQDPEAAKKAKAQAGQAQAELRRFVAEHGDALRRDPWRERSRGEDQFTSGRKNGTINIRGDGMGVDIAIDRFTPCLFDTRTGDLVETFYSLASPNDLKGLKAQGWLFNWLGKDLKDSEIYKLTLKGDSEIQGLVAMESRSDAFAYHVSLAESAPHNRGNSKVFDGVGGHLFAIAAQKSMDAGYGGFIFFEAKNRELVNHYAEKFGAVWLGRPHEYSMIIDEEAAQNLLENYTLNGG